MIKRMLMASVFAVVTGAAAHAQSTGTGGNMQLDLINQDITSDKKDIRHDARDLRKDEADLHRDLGALTQAIKDGAPPATFFNLL